MEKAARGLRTGSLAAVLGVFLVLYAAPADAGDALSASGRLDFRGVDALDSNSIPEDPDLLGRIKLESTGQEWRFRTWLEGGWDGTVRKPVQDHSLFKNFDQVYQSNTPYLEVKELFLARTLGRFEVRAGVQRFAWGRLDEYPPNDLLNPWDYTRFLRKPLEDRKIGVPSLSGVFTENDWVCEAVWVPVMVPYRLPLPSERWSGTTLANALVRAVPGTVIDAEEPRLPDRNIANSNAGLRIRHQGDLEWAVDLYHGYDPKPVFRTASLVILPAAGTLFVDPGYVPDFHRITSLGADAAAVWGQFSIRAEAAYIFNRWFDIDRRLWGYPASLTPGVHPLNPSIEQKHDSVEYGVGADYRLYEDMMLTLQAQQTLILGNVDELYERSLETLLWANLKTWFLNQKIETNATLAWNPEHGDRMTTMNGWYVFSDYWKAGLAWAAFTGPEQSLFGRFARNDQIELEARYSW